MKKVEIFWGCSRKNDRPLAKRCNLEVSHWEWWREWTCQENMHQHGNVQSARSQRCIPQVQRSVEATRKLQCNAKRTEHVGAPASCVSLLPSTLVLAQLSRVLQWRCPWHACCQRIRIDRARLAYACGTTLPGIFLPTARRGCCQGVQLRETKGEGWGQARG